MNSQPLSANQKFILALAAIGALTVGLLRAAPAQQPVQKRATIAPVVNARAFQVVDRKGMVRVALELAGEKDETASVRLWNPAGKVTAEVRVGEKNTQFVLAGPDGKHQTILTSAPEGPGLLMGTGEGKQPRLHLLVDEFGEPHVRLFGKTTRSVGETEVGPSGERRF